MLRNNLCWSDGRLVKLFLFSTLLDKSPLTFSFIYFTTLKAKEELGLPCPHNQTFWFLVKFHFFWLYEYWVSMG